MSNPPEAVVVLRELTLQGCEAARQAAEAAAESMAGAPTSVLGCISAREEQLDSLDRQINEAVTHAMAGVGEPHARELLSCLKFILELERIGDLLLNFANRARSVGSRLHPDDAATLHTMATLLERMLEDATVAFRDRNIDRALSALRADAELDRLRNLMFIRHIENPEGEERQESFHLVFMTQVLERAGDHTKNMAEEVVHLVTGRSVRHLLRQTDKSFEEMFVDYMRRKESGRHS